MSALRRAARIASTISLGLAQAVPGRSAPAANSIGAISEKPTKATLRPSRRTTCGVRARLRLAPAPTALMPWRSTPLTVSTSARGP